MEKTIKFLLATTFLFLGIIIGFMWSPAKKGIYCGNNNGNTYGGNELGYDPEDWDDEDAIKF
ncbi:hypothetical protein V6615_00180 [Oscillospiraceae bacterium PP1C4]